MIVYTLEQRLEISQHYFENRGNVAECVRKLCTDFWRRKAPSAQYVRYLVKKKWKKQASPSINQCVKSQKQCVHPGILLLWQKVFWSAIIINWTFRRHHWDAFCIKTLVWSHTKFNWFRSWSQWTIQFVFASLSGPAIDLQKMPIMAKKSSFQMKLILNPGKYCDRSTYRRCRFWQKKIIFSDQTDFDLGEYVNKQNCHIWGTENPHA